MYTYKRMPASQNQMEGIFDWMVDWVKMPSFVRSYWDAIKGKIQELRSLGFKINSYKTKIVTARQKLVQSGDSTGAAALDDEIKKIDDDMEKWRKVVGYIDTYLPEWTKLSGGTTTGPSAVSGLGAVPFVLAGTAIVALAYCVNVGMALLQDYAFKSQLTQAVIDQKLTSGQMRDILSVPRDTSVLEKVVSTVGVTAAIGLPTLLLIGGGIYLAMYSGMLKGLIGGGQSSSESKV